MPTSQRSHLSVTSLSKFPFSPIELKNKPFARFVSLTLHLAQRRNQLILESVHAVAPAWRLPVLGGSHPSAQNRVHPGSPRVRPLGSVLCLETTFEVRANLSSPQGVRSVGRRLFENSIFAGSSPRPWCVPGPADFIRRDGPAGQSKVHNRTLTFPRWVRSLKTSHSLCAWSLRQRVGFVFSNGGPSQGISVRCAKWLPAQIKLATSSQIGPTGLEFALLRPLRWAGIMAPKRKRANSWRLASFFQKTLRSKRCLRSANEKPDGFVFSIQPVGPKWLRSVKERTRGDLASFFQKRSAALASLRRKRFGIP